jgi:hypothetical protein
MKTVALLLALFAMPVLADEKYSNDDLCRAIGETSNAVIQPRDRLFFEKSCVCYRGSPCMEKGTPKARAAGEAAAKAAARAKEEDRKTAEAEKARRAERARAKGAAEKRARETCRAEKDAWGVCSDDFARKECDQELAAFDACCTKAGIPDRVDCADLFRAVVRQ